MSRISLTGRAAGVRIAATAAIALAIALAVGALTPGVADARGLTTGFTDPLFQSGDAATRDTWSQRARDDGAGIIRINVDWRRVATSKPVLPTNPADPAYDFSTIDDAVRSAKRQGVDVMLTLWDAPSWAEGPNKPGLAFPGSWKPNPADFGDFAEAVAKRYSGSFLGLPRVHYFEAWNEPNLSINLSPQWDGKKAVAPDRYRRLLNAFYSGVKKVQSDATVIGGATAPFGDPRTQPHRWKVRMRPLIFLRNLFCLDSHMKPRSCSGSKPHLDVLSHHPINFLNDPHYSAISPNDIEVADFNKVRRVMRAAERSNHVAPGGHHDLWATEIFWITTPPSQHAVPVNKAARWLEEALYMLWNKGASAVVNYEIRDFEYKGGLRTTSGVFYFDDSKKPSYTSYRFPFVTHRISKKRVGVWGKAPISGTLQVQEHGKKGWRTVKKGRVHAGRIFTPSIRLPGDGKLRGKIGQTTSLTWRQSGPKNSRAAASLSARKVGAAAPATSLSTRAWWLREVPGG